jgi:hypothetical protein
MSTTIYANTVIQEARTLLTVPSEQKFELRPVNPMVVNAFLKYREQAILNLAEIKAANQQVTKLVYSKNKAFTINASRSNTPSGEQSGSAIGTLSWNEKNFVIKYNEKLFQNNEVTAMRAFAVDRWNAEKTFWENLETNVLVAFLEANKSTVNDGDGEEGTLGSGNMVIAADNVDLFYNIVDAHMKMNNFEAPFQDVHSMFWESKKKFYANQGVANQTNLAFQYDGFDFFPSNKVTPADATYLSKHYIIPTGGLAMVNWNNPLNREGKEHANGRLFVEESLFFPGLFFDVFAKESWGNTGSTGSGELTGDIQDPTIDYEYTLHYANWTHPFSESGRSAIYRYDNLKNAGV